jgi:hypothetical protein
MVLEIVRDTMRRKHYSYQTEKSYVPWVKRYVGFHHKRHPREMGQAKSKAFLTHCSLRWKAKLLPQPSIKPSTQFFFSTVIA